MKRVRPGAARFCFFWAAALSWGLLGACSSGQKVGGSDGGCGGLNQPCCVTDGAVCNDPSLACDILADSVCHPCGHSNELCCTSGPSECANATLACAGGGQPRCGACGQLGEPCCGPWGDTTGKCSSGTCQQTIDTGAACM
jgi:hypothetical protein